MRKRGVGLPLLTCPAAILSPDENEQRRWETSLRRVIKEDHRGGGVEGVASEGHGGVGGASHAESAGQTLWVGNKLVCLRDRKGLVVGS